VRTALAGLLLFVPMAAAVACGYCVEDKVAAAYDHSVIVRSLGRGHEVAFFAIEGTLAVSPKGSREIHNALEFTRGVDRGTARVSPDGTSLSFAYDPGHQGLRPIMRALEKSLAPRALSISLLRVLK